MTTTTTTHTPKATADSFELKIPDEKITGPIPDSLNITYEDLEKERPSNVIDHPSMAGMAERLKSDQEELHRLQSQINNKDIDDALEQGQDGDAALFVKRFKNRYVFDHGTGLWYYWNDHFWREDKINQVMKSIQTIIDPYETERQRLVNLLQTSTADDSKKKIEFKINQIKKRIERLHTLQYKENILKIAASGVESLGIPGDAWDAKPMLLGVRNGCVDLTTGQFRYGEPEDYIKTVCPTPWTDINAVPHVWIDYLNTIFDGDQEIIGYIQRLLGYGITGLTSENIYPILYGEHGQNGKGTLIETALGILGGKLAVKLSSAFMMQRGAAKASNSPDAELFSLRGARIAWCSETNKGERMNVSLVKEISGSDTISVRPPYGRDQVHFTPSHLIFILTNRKPQMPADDDALWLRTHIIEFLFSFVEKPDPNKPWQRKRDTKLSEKLKAEYYAILAWMVRGCIEWQKHGLKPPKKITQAAEDYRKAEDIFQDFLDEATYPESGGFFERKRLFDRYKTWCSESEYKRMNIKHFYEELERKLGRHCQLYGSHGPRGYHGWSILSGSYEV